MDCMKWTAVLLIVVSAGSAGCCGQPCSWCNWGSTTYAPPPATTYPAYPGPVTTAPITTAPMTTPPPGSVPLPQ